MVRFQPAVTKTAVGGRLEFWLQGALLASCFVFSSEVVVWTDIQRDIWLWLPLIVGYVLVSVFLLDTLDRFNVHDLWGFMIMSGLYATLASLLLNPEAVALDKFPTTLITRIMGAQALAGLIGLMLFNTLVKNITKPRIFIGISILLGFFWGIWSHDSRVFINPGQPPLSILTPLGVATVVMLMILGLWIGTKRYAVTSNHVRRLATRWEWGIVIVTSIGLLLLGWIRNMVDLRSFFISSDAYGILFYGTVVSKR